MFGLILAISVFAPAGLSAAIPQTPSQAPGTFLNIAELAAACVPPSIRITVVSPGTAGKNTTTQLSIPIFTDCTYQKSTPVTPAQNSAAPSSAISSSADYDQYVDANGNPLDKSSMNQLLQFFGDVVDLDVLLEETACAITDTNNNVDTIQSDNEALSNVNSVKVLNYQCIIALGQN